jgi:hypothetical protein
MAAEVSRSRLLGGCFRTPTPPREAPQPRHSMNLLAIILGYTVSMAGLLGVLICGALGSPYWAIGCGLLAVWTAFGSAHLARGRKQDAEWEDAMRHPRI